MIKLKDILFQLLENVPQRGISGGEPIKWKPDAKIDTKELTVDEIINGIKWENPYYNHVIEDYDNNDFYSWEVTTKVIEYAKNFKDNPQSIKNLDPIIVVDGELQDGAHRISAIYLLIKRMDSTNSFWKNVKLKVQFGKSEDVLKESYFRRVPVAPKRSQFVQKIPESEYENIKNLRLRKKLKITRIAELYHTSNTTISNILLYLGLMDVRKLKYTLQSNIEPEYYNDILHLKESGLTIDEISKKLNFSVEEISSLLEQLTQTKTALSWQIKSVPYNKYEEIKREFLYNESTLSELAFRYHTHDDVIYGILRMIERHEKRQSK